MTIEVEQGTCVDKQHRDIVMHTEERLVTPEMAAAWLRKNKRNRAMNNKRVELYAREIASGNWYLHHQGIGFYEDDTLGDGQHRLAAIVKSGVPVKMLVSWGIPEESGIMIDGHQQRRAHQAIAISGLADWITKDHIAVARLMMVIGSGKVSSSKHTLTELVHYCESHRRSMEFAEKSILGKKRFITSAITRSAIACAYNYEDPDRLIDFGRVMVSGMVGSQEDRAAILAREWLLTEGMKTNRGSERHLSVKRVMRAIKAFCERQKIAKLYQPESFIYLPVAEDHDKDFGVAQ